MLISSSNDMAKYLTELIKGFTGKGTVLKKETYEELYKEQLNENHFEEGERNAEHPYDGDYNPAIFLTNFDIALPFRLCFASLSR